MLEELRKKRIDRVYRVMKQLGLPPSVQHTRLNGLSGGERARLAIARMLLSRANLLILDEPTNHLDLAARSYLQEALHYFDGGVLLASHDRHFASALATRVVALDYAVAADDGGDGGDGGDADVAVRLSHVPDYAAYLAARPLEAEAHEKRADADRRRRDAMVMAGDAYASPDGERGPRDPAEGTAKGRRAAKRKRYSAKQQQQTQTQTPPAGRSATLPRGGRGAGADGKPKARRASQSASSRAAPGGKKKKRSGGLDEPYWKAARRAKFNTK